MITPVLISIIISLVIALLAIAFYTLLERKILGYIQTRKGPNKISLIGLPQPLADALKLFLKEQNIPLIANITPFIISPLISLLLAGFLWTIYPHQFSAYHISFSILLFIIISRLNVYTVLGAGWTSNSKYALLGALRRIAQTISYEISIALILILPLIMVISFRFYKFNLYLYSPLFIPILIIFVIWIISALAETNRSPFDLAEGESELVSGFNTEYRGGEFTLIFIAEYINILVISLFSTLLFLSIYSINLLYTPTLILKLTIVRVLFIWLRATLPRIRYDRLIALTWKVFLPFSITLNFLFTTFIFILV